MPDPVFQSLDYTVIIVYVLILTGIGYVAWRQHQRSLAGYFNSGRNLPWWLLGTSMVATTFAADTPLAVTGIVAADGLSGNWIWWNFMFSSMFTVFLYARLWKRAGVITDVEFIEKRYSGKPAAFLRGFRAVYLAFPINCIILGWVTVGMAKILSVITPFSEWTIILGLYGFTGFYIMLTGLWGVVLSDFFQFLVAMVGSIVLAVLAVQHVGGLDGLQSGLVSNFGEDHFYLDFLPLRSPDILLSTFLVWIGMMWWASWYPGAEPGGGGYIAQRMFSAKDERNAVGGTLFFNVAHYALRPWPWILVGLVSILVYPELDDRELGYPKLMVELLPAGLFGLLVVAFLSAFVSTVSTHLNWGASYLVNDVYKRFMKKPETFSSEDQADKHYVWMSRLATILIMVTAVIVSWFFDTVKEGWEAILALGAGTGPVYLLRWFWWRINAWSEIAAMSGAAVGVILANVIGIDGLANTLFFTTIFSTIVWLTVTFLTKPASDYTLQKFCDEIRPGGPGWGKFRTEENASKPLSYSILKAFSGAFAILFILYGTGMLLFSSYVTGILSIAAGTIVIGYLVNSVRNE